MYREIIDERGDFAKKMLRSLFGEIISFFARIVLFFQIASQSKTFLEKTDSFRAGLPPAGFSQLLVYQQPRHKIPWLAKTEKLIGISY